MKSHDLLGAIRDHIRAGAFSKAKPLIRTAATLRLSRAERLRLANYANDTIQPGIAVSLLHRYIRPQRTKSDASDEEKSEYGLALVRFGSPKEAMELLASVDLMRLPRAANTLAMAYLWHWDYEPVIKLLSKIIHLPKMSEFSRLESKELLSAALLHGRDDFTGTEQSLREIMSKASTSHFLRIRINSMYMLMQNQFLQKKWSAALALLDEMDALMDETGNELIPVIHQKWRTLIELKKQNRVKAQIKKLAELKLHFVRLGNWKEYRSVDYYVARITQDRALAARVYYGTPFKGCRKKLLRALSMNECDLPPFYDFGIQPAQSASTAPFLLHVLNGKSARSSPLKIGQIQQRLLQALVMDFYNPPDVVQLFARLYPKDYFDPASSHLRVSQALKRLRLWLKENRIPLKIEARQGVFRFVSDRPVVLRIARELVETEHQIDLKTSELLAQILEHYSDRPFSASQLQSLCGVSRSLAVAWLRDACQAGNIARTGAGPSTKYSLKNRGKIAET